MNKASRFRFHKYKGKKKTLNYIIKDITLTTQTILGRTLTIILGRTLSILMKIFSG